MNRLATALAVAAVFGGSQGSEPYGVRFRPGAPAKKKPPEVAQRRAARKAAKIAKRRNRK